MMYGAYTDDMTRVLFGEHARRVPVQMWLQDAGAGTVSMVGVSHMSNQAPHPLRYSSPRTHLFVVGELVLRPSRLILATDAHRGDGLGALATTLPSVAEDCGPGLGEVVHVSSEGVPGALR